MKKAIQYLLLATPVALLWYMKGALVPAVDAKNLTIRGVVFCVALLCTILFFSDKKTREDISTSVQVFWKNPLGKILTISYGLLGLSTIFAYDRFSAFFGTATRGEGFVGLSFFYLLMLFLVLFLEKKEWINLWKITAFSGMFVFLKELIQFMGGAYRPGSVMDNPIFLAGYFLIVIFSGLIVWTYGRDVREKKWQWVGLLTVLSAVLGIFITESRGVMFGLIVGVVVTLGYLWKNGKSISLTKKYSVRMISGGVIVAGLLFGGVFFLTRTASFWSNIPGLSRVAQFSSTDLTTQSRIANMKLTLKAIAPAQNNIKNTFIGWGWDNYVFAWQRHYDPMLYQYDKAIFDRAHNKLLDVLVMNGTLGFVAYMILWFLIFRAAFLLGKQSLFEGAAVILFSVAFFVQNLFVFDTIISSVSLFTLVAFLITKTQMIYDAKK